MVETFIQFISIILRENAMVYIDRAMLTLDQYSHDSAMEMILYEQRAN